MLILFSKSWHPVGVSSDFFFYTRRDDRRMVWSLFSLDITISFFVYHFCAGDTAQNRIHLTWLLWGTFYFAQRLFFLISTATNPFFSLGTPLWKVGNLTAVFVLFFPLQLSCVYLLGGVCFLWGVLVGGNVKVSWIIQAIEAEKASVGRSEVVDLIA